VAAANLATESSGGSQIQAHFGLPLKPFEIRLRARHMARNNSNRSQPVGEFQLARSEADIGEMVM